MKLKKYLKSGKVNQIKACGTHFLNELKVLILLKLKYHKFADVVRGQ